MGIKEYLIESFGSGEEKAMFISPKGDFIAGDTSHIDMVTSNPRKFGYTIEEIRKIYEKYKERMGVEGRARDEILINIMKQGWIHIRRRPNLYWNVMIGKMNKRTQGFLYDWANKILKGVHGIKERNKDARVNINSVDGRYSKMVTVEDITRFALHEKVEDLGYKLIVCDISEIEDYKGDRYNV